jgi:predicted DNA binding CopG/RHH family protein
MSKRLPVFKSDKEAGDFLNQDLSEYISAENFAPFQFEFRPKQKSVNLRISEELLNAVRAVARRRGIPYQRYIRQTLEAALRPSKEPRSGKGSVHRSGKR